MLGAGAVAAALVMGGITAPAATAQDAQEYLLATASTGGTYYPVGVALSTLIKVRLQPSMGINVSAINSAGSGENVALLRDDEAQFAIVQGLFGAYAATGTGPLAEAGAQEGLRSITMLWPNVEHFIIRSDLVDSGTVSDVEALAGEPMALGRQNSGTIGSNRTILAGFGIDMDEAYELVYAGYGPSADALQNGQVVGMSTPAGAPVGAVSRAFAAMGDDITLLEFTDEQMAAANGDFDELWTRYVIPAGTYPGVDEDVNTIAQPNFLMVRDDVPEETIYEITKTIYENLTFLQGIHPATNAMSLDVAIAGLPLPLHPGAIRYYEEQGITVPDRLKPDM
ncbi:MAG: TAXI family TRAP transporter solute-binding subunit [Devosiaceae bacterium]|nr:TAXI family TRAP transporter solute-binding subunit [Devosiaceae bacterium MH13]